MTWEGFPFSHSSRQGREGWFGGQGAQGRVREEGWNSGWFCRGGGRLRVGFGGEGALSRFKERIE